MRSHRSTVFIRNKDLGFFRYLFAFKVATVEQISRDIYPGLTLNAIRKRVNRMIDEGLISSQYEEDLAGKLVYTLGPRGLHDYILGGTHARQEWRSANVSHDVTLVDIAHKLQSSAKVKLYYPEHLLKTGIGVASQLPLDLFRDLRPDGLAKLGFLNGDFHVAIEYEASFKKRSRYEAKFRAYQTSSDVAGVLYVSDDQELISYLKSTELKLTPAADSKFYYQSLSELLGGDDVKFVRADGGILTLN